MRPNQQNNKQRSRGRSNNNNRRGGNPLSRNYESNGPDVRVRGNAAHIAEKYVQLARDAASSGDGVMAENYLQHAEHYFRIISAAQAQNQQRFDQTGQQNERDDDEDDGAFDDGPRQHATGDAPRQRDTQREASQASRESRDDKEGWREPERERSETSEEEGEERPRRQRRTRRSQQAENQAGVATGEEEPQAGNTVSIPGSEAEESTAKPRRTRRPRQVKSGEGEGGSELPAFLTEGRETAAE